MLRITPEHGTFRVARQVTFDARRRFPRTAGGLGCSATISGLGGVIRNIRDRACRAIEDDAYAAVRRVQGRQCTSYERRSPRLPLWTEIRSHRFLWRERRHPSHFPKKMV